LLGYVYPPGLRKMTQQHQKFNTHVVLFCFRFPSVRPGALRMLLTLDHNVNTGQ